MSKTSRSRMKKRHIRYIAASFIAGAVTMILILVISFGIGSFYSNAQEEAEETKYYKSIQIEEGDSLWSIAEKYMNDDYESIYSYMAELAELNQLADYELDHLQEGDYLMVAYYE